MERDERLYPISEEKFTELVLPIIEASYRGKGRRASAFSFQGLEFTKTLKNFEPQTNLRFENTKMRRRKEYSVVSCLLWAPYSWLVFLENSCEFKEILTIKK